MIGTLFANGILLVFAVLLAFAEGEHIVRSLARQQVPVVTRALPAWVPFDSFIDLIINRRGHDVGEFSGKGGSCGLEVLASAEKPNGCLRIDYDVTLPSSYAGYNRPVSGLDLAGVTALAFEIKGYTGGETCSVELSNGTVARKVPLTNVLADGCAREWRKVRLPLSLFGAREEWRRDTATLAFVFENDTDILWRSTVYVRNVGFER